jgi:hypothetical protein
MSDNLTYNDEENTITVNLDPSDTPEENRQAIQAAIDYGNSLYQETGEQVQVILPEGEWEISAIFVDNQYIGLELKSGVVLSGAGMPVPNENGEIITDPYTILRLDDDGAYDGTLVNLVRSEKSDAVTEDYGVTNLGLDATSNYTSTNALYLGDDDYPDENVTIANVYLSGGSGDYIGSQGAGYGLDVLGVENGVFANIIIDRSTRGAYFADSTNITLTNIIFNEINTLGVPEVDGRKRFGLMIQDSTEITLSNISFFNLNNSGENWFPMWVEDSDISSVSGVNFDSNSVDQGGRGYIRFKNVATFAFTTENRVSADEFEEFAAALIDAGEDGQSQSPADLPEEEPSIFEDQEFQNSLQVLRDYYLPRVTSDDVYAVDGDSDIAERFSKFDKYVAALAGLESANIIADRNTSNVDLRNVNLKEAYYYITSKGAALINDLEELGVISSAEKDMMLSQIDEIISLHNSMSGAFHGADINLVEADSAEQPVHYVGLPNSYRALA